MFSITCEKLVARFKYDDVHRFLLQIAGFARRKAGVRSRCVDLEVHFGKPVIARVRKCRLVVVKNKRQQDEDCAAEERR